MLDRVELPLDRARRATLAASIEDTDSHGDWIPRARREEGTRAARASLDGVTDPAALATAVADRADRMLEPVLAREPALARAAQGAPRGLLFGLVVLPALLYGIGRSALGPDSDVDLFQNPLVALIIWNLLVVVVTIVGRVFVPPRRVPLVPEDGAASRQRTPWLSTRIAEWLLLVGVGGRRLADAERTAQLGRILSDFAGRWRRAASPLLAGTVRLGLHVAALLLLATAVGEAYVRGLFTQYEVSWQSTFLDPSAAESLARALFGPPAAILGEGPIVLPAEGLSEDAAPWIHRFALAALLYGVLPRLLLVFTSWNARRRVRAVPVALAPGLARRLRAHSATGFARVSVLPYSVHLEPTGADRLRGLLAELLGERAVIEFLTPLSYGDDVPESEETPAEDLARIVILPLAQPPEIEVHGEFLLSLARESAPVVALLDASALRRRFGDSDEGRKRLEERRRNWDRVLEETGVARVHLDLGEDPDDSSYAEFGRALRRARGEDVA